MQQSSSVLHLPVEILELIFLYAVPVSPYCRAWDPDTQWSDTHPFLVYLPRLQALDDRYSFGNQSQSPWSVSQVCKNWRTVSLSRPELWSYIGELRVCVDERRNIVHEGGQNIVKRLELALERSKDKGLSLVMSAVGTSNLQMPMHTIYSRPGCFLPNAVFRLLVNHTKRWERLCSADVDFPWVRVLPNSEPSRSYPGSSLNFPRLKALAAVHMATVVPMSSVAPKLKTICRFFDGSGAFQVLEGLETKKTVRNYCALSSLSDLGRLVTVDPGLRFFGQMSHLTNFQLILGPPGVSSQDTVHITLPGIDSLCLCMPYIRASEQALKMMPAPALQRFLMSNEGLVEQALNMISAPALQRLQLSYLSDPSPLISHIDRSSCTLLSLSTDKAHIDSHEILKLLTRLSNIENLHISFDMPGAYGKKRVGFLNDSLLQSLLDPSKAICRQLRTLTLLHTRDLNLPMIFDMLGMQLSSEPDIGLGLFHREITIKTDDYIEDMISAKYKALLKDLRRQKKLSVELTGAQQSETV